MAIPEVPDLENLVKLKIFFEDFRQGVEEEIAAIVLAAAAPPSGAAIDSGPAESKPTGSTITSSDDGATISNLGATGSTVHVMDSGLAEGFEIRVIQIAGFDMAIRPPLGEFISIGGSRGLSGQGLILTSAVPFDAAFTIKKLGNVWVRVAGDEGPSAVFEALQLAVRNLASVNGLINTAVTSVSTSTGFTIRLVQEVSPNSVLGSDDEASNYVDGADIGSVQGVYLEIQETSGAGFVRFNSEIQSSVTITPQTLADYNATGNQVVAKTDFNAGASNNIVVPANQTDTFWVDTDGGMYARNQAGGAVTSFADAVLAGKV